VPIDPLRYRFRVECPKHEAFWLWTGRAGTWWPMATHSVSGEREAALAFEPRTGGRIYEQTPDGLEFLWGHVVIWEPPDRLVCQWLVGETATDLEVRFVPEPDGATIVEIEHRGWERFGEVGTDRRDVNERGWSGVIAAFQQACKTGTARS
jgi:hypothetical protein